MPSLHVAYPLLIVVIGWPYLKVVGRTLANVFFCSMCFAAVYLDHHWVIDVVVGLVYCVVVYPIVGLFFRRAEVIEPVAQESLA